MASKAEKLKRQEEVRREIFKRKSSKEICTKFAKAWGVKYESVRHYIEVVNKELEEINKYKIEMKLGRAIQETTEFYQACLANRQYSVAVAALKELHELEGLKIIQLQQVEKETFNLAYTLEGKND